MSPDGVKPVPSRDTLMGLHYIHWILQQILRISQSPEQKLCHKARWFYGMVTWRPFKYREPSITARSSGASFNLYVDNMCSCIIKSIPWAKCNVIRHFCWFRTMFELIWYHQQTFPSATLKSLRFSKNWYVGPHGPWPTRICLYVKIETCMYVNMETRKHVPAQTMLLF